MRRSPVQAVVGEAKRQEPKAAMSNEEGSVFMSRERE
jgi:hypothetical protein